jgi:hypothetical protein
VITYNYTDGNGCSGSSTDTITLNAAPTVSLSLATDTACAQDAAVTLSGGMPAGGTFSGTGVTGTTFDPAVGAGPYVVTYSYTDALGCAASATENFFVDVCNQVSSNVLNEISIYPNPNKGVFFVETGVLSGDCIAELFTVQGKLLQKVQLNAITRNEISTSTLPNGIYMLRIAYEGHVKNFKITVSK